MKPASYYFIESVTYTLRNISKGVRNVVQINTVAWICIKNVQTDTHISTLYIRRLSRKLPAVPISGLWERIWYQRSKWVSPLAIQPKFSGMKCPKKWTMCMWNVKKRKKTTRTRRYGRKHAYILFLSRNI